MKTFAIKTIPAAALGLTLLSACGHAQVSEQLTDARKTVQAARQSEAQQIAPEQLARADRLLRRAEDEENGSSLEQHYAYLADRQARIALAETARYTLRREAEAEREAYMRDLEQSAVGRRQQVQSQAQQLAQVRQELADVRAELQRSGQVAGERTARLRQRETELAQREAQLVEEREARRDADQRAEEAMKRLSEIAEVKESQANTVITLTGEVLFETDKAVLLPQARQRLGQVADALKAQPHEKIVVEGHTDTQGSPDYNRELSQARAESVRDFLEEQGVPGRIEAIGRGETEPIADNSNPEGRALNRRVEIVVE